MNDSGEGDGDLGARGGAGVCPVVAHPRDVLVAEAALRARAGLPAGAGHSRVLRLVAAAGLVAAAMTVAGCCYEYPTASCGVAPAVAIVAFVVTVSTGRNGTDADLSFCHAPRSGAAPTCLLMDNGAFYNDFSPGSSDTYILPLSSAVSAGELGTFSIFNGGGPGFLDDWSIAAIRISGRDGAGLDYLLYEETNVGCNHFLQEGESYLAMDCPY